MLSDSEIENSEQLDPRKAEEGEGEGDENADAIENFKTQPKQSLNKGKDQIVSASAYGSKVKSIVQKQSINKNRAHTAERNKRRGVLPRLIDTSRENGDKVWFPNIDPKGYQEEIERNDPKLKSKPIRTQESSVILLNDLGSVRPKTTDAGKRKINLLRRFHGDLINSK